MVDTATIFTALTKRNALRREAGLPLLNLRHELEHEVALAKLHEVDAVATEHDDDRIMIREQVAGELRAKYGEDFGKTSGGRWALNYETEKRFRRHLLEVYGVVTPDVRAKNAIIYGQGKSAVLVVTED